jgi:N-acetylglutamate synthase-like GNAT family acetyltransferase
MSIRRAATADLPAIPAVTTDYAAALGHSRVWVLASSDKVIGALVTEQRSDHLLLEMIAVAPGAQGTGCGRLLLERAENDAVELGLSEVRLYTNEAMTQNLSFYPRHGYRETGRAVDDGFRRVYFSKTLRDNDLGDPTE